MEFLLANHPLDCPICDQGGECDLQVIIFSYSIYSVIFMLPQRFECECLFDVLFKINETKSFFLFEGPVHAVWQ